MSRELDRTDQRILAILRQDGRITNQALAEKVHLSPRACLDRVRKLERDGVIRSYCAIIDAQSIGRSVTVFAEVTLRDQGAATQRNFEQRMRDTPEVVSCHLVSGTFDYLVRLACRDLEHYRTLTSQWIDEAPLGVARVASAPELQTVKETYGIPVEILS